MNLKMGGQIFSNVQIPLLWGERAIVQDKNGRVSIIDLSGDRARVEILSDEPAPNVVFRPRIEGVVIVRDGHELYSFNAQDKTISSLTLGLPEVQLAPAGTRIGSSWFSGNRLAGIDVGIEVRADGWSLGAPLPSNLAKLRI